MPPGKLFFTQECDFFVVPGEIFLFAIPLPHVPAQGWLLDYYDFETDVTTRYSVQDVILQVDRVAAIPESPGPPLAPAVPETHLPGYRIEIRVVP